MMAAKVGDLNLELVMTSVSLDVKNHPAWCARLVHMTLRNSEIAPLHITCADIYEKAISSRIRSDRKFEHNHCNDKNNGHHLSKGDPRLLRFWFFTFDFLATYILAHNII